MNKIILSLIVLFSFINLNAQCTLEKGNSDFPFTINGVTVTGSGTGGYTSYSSAWTSCGVSTKANSVWIGQSPSTYTNNFSAGVNDMIYNMTAADPGEVITITSNGGAVSITSLASTCTNAYTINGNQLSFVNVSNSGVKVKISTPNPFTTINFSHNGSSGGVLMTMCFDGVAAVLSNPQINNLSATNITSASATINANVAADGGSTITARGFYYGTTSNPTTNQTPLTGTLGSMSTSISGLTPGTLYYYRAYATNANGTTYAQDTFSTTVGNSPPTISTISNQNNCEGQAINIINFTVNDAETPSSLLTLTATSSNNSLIPNDSLVLGGTGNNRTLSYNPISGVYDSSIITVTVNDTSGNSSSTSFVIYINEDKLTTSSDTVEINSGGSYVVIDSLIQVNESNSINGAKVLISEGFVVGDQLDFQGILPSGVTKNYSSSTGVLSFNGNINPSDLQSIFRNVQIKTTSMNAQNRKVTFMIGSAIPYGQNNHYYEFVTNQGISFTDAKNAAENLTFYGLKGYLATITSQAENQFVVSKLQGQGWFGASDAASEGVWKWVSGPEAGTQFWSGGSNGSSVGGLYHNWAPGEPNNCCGGENYIHFLTNGKWNDYPLSLGSIQGYVVEYGGMPGDGCVKLTADKMVKVTLNVAPTITSISNQEVCFNDTLNNVSFTINDLNDDVNTLNVSVASSNTNLIDASNISITRTNGALNLSLYSNTGSTGTSTITITVEDSYGASNSTSFDVTVQDIINPVAITKNITIELDSIGNASITPSMINDGSNDNCKLDSLSVSQIAFNCSHLGSNQVILTAYDLFGNTDTAFAIVTVVSNDIDTDNDGMKDNCDDDDDNDGLTDLQEIQIGTNPKNPDSDGDGVSDSKEVTDNTNPLSNCSFILASQNLTPNATWNNADCDNDGLTNAEEVNLNTDPLNPDSDGDGIKDGEEIKIGTDPLNPDSDGDGINDGEEVSKGWNPLVTDTDGDGLTDGEEVKLGTDPLKKDTDGDGVIDGQEVKDGTNPLDPCASNYNNKTEDYNDDFLNGDCDKDGISNGDEIGPNRNNPFDANNNGIPDYLEFNNFVAGTAADSLEIYNALSTNGDGLNDVLVIRNVNLYPDNNIVIYNKWGVVIYQATGYGQNNKFFRGKVNTKGKDEETVSTGTYYYVFKYKDKKDVEKTVVGYLYISN